MTFPAKYIKVTVDKNHEGIKMYKFSFKTETTSQNYETRRPESKRNFKVEDWKKKTHTNKKIIPFIPAIVERLLIIFCLFVCF